MAQTDYTKIAFLSFDWDYEVISECYRGMDLFTREAKGLQVIVFSAFGHHHLRSRRKRGHSGYSTSATPATMMA